MLGGGGEHGEAQVESAGREPAFLFQVLLKLKLIYQKEGT
jgi:hypothetical protein